MVRMKKNQDPPAGNLPATTEQIHEAEVMEELSPEEKAEKQRLIGFVHRMEKALSDDQHVILTKGIESLNTLKEKRLYRDTHKTWEEFVQATFKRSGRWGRTAAIMARANEIAAKVRGEITQGSETESDDEENSENGPRAPFTLKLAKLLECLDPAGQDRAIEAALKASSGEKPSRAQVKEAVKGEKKQTRKQRIKELETLLEAPVKGGHGPASARTKHVNELAELKGEPPPREDRPKLLSRLTLEQVRAEIDGWVRTLKYPNKSQPVKQTAAIIRELFV